MNKNTPIGSSTIRKYVLVGVGIAFGESVSLAVGFEVSSDQAKANGSLSLLPVHPDVELSTMSLTLSACMRPCLPS